MAIGGFNGTDLAPTVGESQAYVAAGRIHYIVAGGAGRNFPGRPRRRGQSSTTTASQISAWVASNFTSTTVGGVTTYDLSTPVHSDFVAGGEAN